MMAHDATGAGAVSTGAVAETAAHIGTQAAVPSCLLILCEVSGHSPCIAVETPVGGVATQASAADVEPTTNDNIARPISSRRTRFMRMVVRGTVGPRQRA
jgi:hypothetical protein